jgi:hypothetical protein
VDESAVDAWHDYLSFHGVAIVAPPRTHRDGTRSLYCKDPDGNTVQLLYESRAECDCWNSLDPNNRGCSCVASWARPT